MSASTEQTITVNAPRDVETIIIDHAFNLVHHGVGSFTHALAPGLYKFKYRRGLAIHETLEEIGDAPRTIDAPELEFSSSVPLSSTRGAEAKHLDAARKLSNETHVSVGSGSRIFAFARWLAEDAQHSHDIATRVTLHKLDGTLLVDLEQHAVVDDRNATTCAGCSIELDPGAYRFRLTRSDEPLEQIVVASPGWQTLVFLLHEPSPAGEVPPAPLASASILMSRGGFDPESEMLRMADAARIALQEKRTTMPRELLSELLDDNFANPMLGIYGGCALATQSPDALPRVLFALDRLVPGHPDVNALHLAVGESNVVVDVPPMLRASWTSVVKASVDGRAFMNPESLAARMPAALLEGTPWLIWSPNAVLDDDDVVVRDVSNDLSELESCVGNFTDGPPVELSGAEEELFSYLTRRARINKKTTKSQPLRLDEKILANTFGTTVANVQSIISGLATKLRGN
ncbi:MAG: hypothetical protein DMF56_13035 [Acidobacteria bacterium]|nr:MAG: hypothetical protein DMF56_13035 [Acidobacteriota bacterium]